MLPTLDQINNLISQTIMFEGTLYKVHRFLTNLYITAYNRYINYKHEAHIEPLQIYRISPNKISHEVQSQFWYQPTSTVRDGEWDIHTNRFEEHFFYKSLKKHFNYGVPWIETELYEKKLEEISEGEINKRRYGENKSTVLQRLQSLDDLYEDIKQNGYKTQRDLRRCNKLAVDTQREHLPPELFEISVNIGRNGEWLFDDGRHRLTISKLLDIDTVPVRVLVRHQEWQEVRNTVAKEQVVPQKHKKVSDHKDIKDLIQ